MNASFEPRRIERHWQRWWKANRSFAAMNPGDPGFDPRQPKYYVLDMFPYPSGAGLHVGHPVGYIGSDIVARRKRMEGYNVLHPMGWDAFGLPAEQYAIQTGQHPGHTTAENVANFRRQLELIGLSYDWDREINTSDVKFYRWTQWLFARLYDEGLVYRAEVPVWWCEDLRTVLANEEVVNGRSERGNFPCVRRPLQQWMLRITAYAERLLDDLDLVNWPESIKTMQREWIGRSEGVEIDFPFEEGGERLTVFTTRPDTVFGATFMVVAPEHPRLEQWTTDERRAAVRAYIEKTASKSDLERSDPAGEKTGVFTGRYVLNPLLDPTQPGARLPVWVADYVLHAYGSGAIMAVPAHDERDFEFARGHGLEIREVVRPPAGAPGLADGTCFTGEGTAVDSGPLDGLCSAAAIERSVELLARRGAGRPKTTYRLRDWLFSRQRYWGEPFPILHREDGTQARVRDEDLPVELPRVSDFTPTEDGAPPLARAESWVNTVDPDTGHPARRDTDTMPGWAGSCWYYLRFMDPHNADEPFSPRAERYWAPVDLYIGGASHAVLHLLYARFWHKVFHDLGLVTTPEPFHRLFNQGMLTAPAYRDRAGRRVPADAVEQHGVGWVQRATGEPVEPFIAQMSKSLRNVVNPDDVIEEYGADAFRLYEMFMAPLADGRTWDPRGIAGCRRFLDRLWRLCVDPAGDGSPRPQLLEPRCGGEASTDHEQLERTLNLTILRVDDAFDAFNFNTAIAAMMSFVNEALKRPAALTRDQVERLLRILSPFAPHVSEELWRRLGHDTSIVHAGWPAVDRGCLELEQFELVVQVMGKVRGRVQALRSTSETELVELARATVARYLEQKQVVRQIVVPGRLVNFVVR